MMMPTSPIMVGFGQHHDDDNNTKKVDEICVTCKVKRSVRPGEGTAVTDDDDDVFEMACSLRRWESTKKLSSISPAAASAAVFGGGGADGSDDIPAEIVLTSLNPPQQQTLLDQTNNHHRSKPPVTTSAYSNKPMPLRSRIRSSNSDIASMAFDPTRSEQLEHLITNQHPSNGRSTSEGAPPIVQSGLRRRRNLSITSLIPPPPSALDALGESTNSEANGSDASSSTFNSHVYRIPLSNILKARICPARDFSTITLQTVSTNGGMYELIFEHYNSFDVVSTFLMSLLPQQKLLLEDVAQTNKSSGMKTNINNHHAGHRTSAGGSTHNQKTPNNLFFVTHPTKRQNSASNASFRKSGSFTMDQFMDKKFREGAQNEGTFERFKRKMSKLSVDMNELVMGIQLPELCGTHCAVCVGGESSTLETETRQYEDMKTTRNFDGFVDAMDMPSPTRRIGASGSSGLPPDTTNNAALRTTTSHSSSIPPYSTNIEGTPITTTIGGRSPPPTTPTITPVASSDEHDNAGGLLNLAFSYELSPSRSRESAGGSRRSKVLLTKSNSSAGSKARTSTAPYDNHHLSSRGSKESHASGTSGTQRDNQVMSGVSIATSTYNSQTTCKVADL